MVTLIDIFIMFWIILLSYSYRIVWMRSKCRSIECCDVFFAEILELHTSTRIELFSKRARDQLIALHTAISVGCFANLMTSECIIFWLIRGINRINILDQRGMDNLNILSQTSVRDTSKVTFHFNLISMILILSISYST